MLLSLQRPWSLTHFGLFTLSVTLILCSLNNAASAQIYYIETTSTDLCTGPCLTLSQFAANSRLYLHSNTTLLFLPGIHYLSLANLTLSNVGNFTMKSENSTAQIKCTSNLHIHFSQSQHVRIANLEFIGCGGNQVKHVEEFMVEDTKFNGQANSGTALELIETTAKIFNGTFLSNIKGSYRECFIHDPDFGCAGDGFVGGAIIANRSVISLNKCKFGYNRADFGGAIFAEQSSITNMSSNVFIKNSAIKNGGVLYSFNSIITITASEFHSSNTNQHGGVLYSLDSKIKIKASEFQNNNVTGSGGVLHSNRSTIQIEESEFHDNSANLGGVLLSNSSTVTVEESEFTNNHATNSGGVLYARYNAITIAQTDFTKNSAPVGAVIYVTDSSMEYQGNVLVDSNSADMYAVIYLSYMAFRGHELARFTFSNNLGSLVIFSSKSHLIGLAMFKNNQPPQTSMGDFQEGGAITLHQSSLLFSGKCNLEHNYAKNGGAIWSTESTLNVNNAVIIAHNVAIRNGGGIYLSNSGLECQQKSTLAIMNNTAINKGGGIHSISSSVKAISAFELLYTGARINFTQNTAKRGGGLALESIARLHILKQNVILPHIGDSNTTIFIANRADYGGAIHVNDDTIAGTCASDPRRECFFQVLGVRNQEFKDFETQSMHFSKNYASISGSTLYGGLLDRCAVSEFAEVHKKYETDRNFIGNGVAYLINVSTPSQYFGPPSQYSQNKVLASTALSISSPPVQVCLCIDNEHDCIYQNHFEVRKGETLIVSLVAIDQIGQPVNATIQTSLNFPESGLAEGQLARKIHSKCTNLTFNVVSPHNLEILTLYASDGPCKDSDLSRANIVLHFLPCSCPIGLQISITNGTNCTCECHNDISKYVEHCDSNTGSLVKGPQSRAWISYINDTDLTGYLVYPNCPFDYCLSTSPPVDLNQPNGADVQCAFNRSSLLCGSCQPELSLSLGSSRCLSCPTYWPAPLTAITIAAILAGIALVALLLVLNMTVAVGTLNGLIFYANVVNAYRSTLLPFQRTSFITVIISWLNLELGIDTCYFPGMDDYLKTWLQLAFPAYVILLVVLVIIISSYSYKFSNLIGKKDPVATLATLILISYSKLLEICFKSLSVGVLEYPNGSSEMLWLPDATIKYLSGKHIPLFIAAILILLVGLVYTALLFSWQWLLYFPRWRIFRLLRNPKIQTFIETYHKPHTPKHRYWTGLLLIVRIILYLIATVNVSNNPAVAFTAICFIVCCIFALRQFIGSRVYRRWPVDVLESFLYLNVLSITIFTWYSLDEPDSNQEAAAYASVMIIFVVLLLIILHHMYAYTTVFSKIRVMDRLFTVKKSKSLRHQTRSPPPDNDIHRFHELLDIIDRPVNSRDYEVPLIKNPVKHTQSVVEMHHPQLAPPDPEEVTNIPNAAEEV